jgi:hypothetical protein
VRLQAAPIVAFAAMFDSILPASTSSFQDFKAEVNECRQLWCRPV